MSWAVIGTWRMSLKGTEKAMEILRSGGSAADACTEAASIVEDDPHFHSVGYSGLPNEDGHVQLDAGFMDGDTLHFGAVGCLEGFRSPIRVARSLADRKYNNFLVGQGAAQYAAANAFEKRINETEDSMNAYNKEKGKNSPLSSYDGHDTVCFLAIDNDGHMAAAVSTSGLFMKANGRVGDSALIGNGYYVDSSIGGACATGLGEDIMKGSLSHTIYMKMKDGTSAKDAAAVSVQQLHAELMKRQNYAGGIAAIALDRSGSYGVGTNGPFAFTFASDKTPVCTYFADAENGSTKIHVYQDSDPALD